MKTSTRILVPLFLLTLAFFVYAFTAGKNAEGQANTNSGKGAATSFAPGQEFNQYWYAGEAELNSFELKQARYGEIREGEAVLVFVAEDFSQEALTKFDGRNGTKIPVLKVNFDKKFNTGIYPYSMLLSVATPVDVGKYPHALKVSASVQEWCGHTYTQLDLEGKEYAFTEHSYFPGEGDQEKRLKAMLTEDELWSRIRIAPSQLPTGNVTMLPGTFYSRLRHAPMAPMKAKLSLTADGDGFSTYTVAYANGNSLKIQFETTFPHRIEGWEESFSSGYGAGAKRLVTTAKRKKTLKLDYWARNRNSDAHLRGELGLD